MSRILRIKNDQRKQSRVFQKCKGSFPEGCPGMGETREQLWLTVVVVVLV